MAEIKTTANLQHPHILPLFDSGEADSFLFYVMPYVEGETHQGRIDREKQLPGAGVRAVRDAGGRAPLHGGDGPGGSGKDHPRSTRIGHVDPRLDPR